MIDPRTAPDVASAVSVKGEVRIEEPTRIERSLARRAAESRATVPDIELRTDVDMELYRAHVEPGAVTAPLAKACALALRAEPRANAAYRDGHYELYSRINVGVAVPTDDTYVIATLFDADDKSLTELTAELTALQSRARSGELTPPESSGATISIFDLGPYGIASASAVINPPHAAALAAGAIREVPVVRDGAVVPRLTMALTLACDHRILYGARAARFLAAIAELLQHPGEL